MSFTRRLLVSLALFAGCAFAHAAAPRAALVTVLDGEARVLRDDGEFAAVEGLALQAGDILVTGPQTHLLRLEAGNGVAVSLGPDSQALLEPHLAGEAPGTIVYLLTGWAKLNVPKGQAAALAGPPLGVTVPAPGGAAVVAWTASAPAGAMVFAESGTPALQARGATNAPATLASGRMLTLAGGAAPVLSPQPTAAFLQALPRAFMDSLPSRAAAFAGKDVQPRRLGALAYADVQPWIDAEPALRRLFVKRWRALVHDTDFRRGLVEGLKQHPEWEPVLYPPTTVHKPANP